MDELPGFGPWQAVEMLGHGGMCAVFRARHADDPGREAAIKVVGDPDADAVRRFADEARLLMSIDHPNVVEVYDVDAEHDPPWMCMQLLSGHDLDEERAALGAFEPERAARIAADLASGLAAIHALGVRHRDIKLANVMLGTDGVPRLIDFGIARKVEDIHKTREGMVVGTAAYLAPEVYLGDDPRQAQDTEASDVYALGQSLCELLTGHAVYDREGDTTTLVEIMRDKMARDGLDPRDWRDSVPADLADIVVEATRREPEDRIATAEQLQLRLEEWLDTRRLTTPAPLSSLDPAHLPLPPQAAQAASDPAEQAAREVKRHDDIERGRGVVGFALGGSFLAVGGLALVFFAGLGALWAGRPQGLAPDAVHAAVAAQAAALGPCVGRQPETMTARWVVRDGRASEVVVDGTTDDTEVRACVASAISGMRFPEGLLAVEAEVRLW